MIWVCFGACGIDVSENLAPSKALKLISLQVIINAVVLLWAMQGPAPASPSRAPSVRFIHPHSARTQQNINIDTLEMGTVHKVPDVYPSPMFEYVQPREEYLSQGMTVSSSVCIPSLEEPEPALRSPRQQAEFGQHPWGNRSPLPTPERVVKRSDVSDSYLKVDALVLTAVRFPVTAHMCLVIRRQYGGQDRSRIWILCPRLRVCKGQPKIIFRWSYSSFSIAYHLFSSRFVSLSVVFLGLLHTIHPVECPLGHS